MSCRAWQRVVEVQHCCMLDNRPAVLAVQRWCSTAAAVANFEYPEHIVGSAYSASEPQLRSHKA